MTGTYNNLTVTSAEDSALEKGKQMWQCLDALAAHYENVDMSKISATSQFPDDKWDVPGDAKHNFNWNSWLPEPEYFPLIMVCKVASYHSMVVLNKKASTVQPYIQSLISVFKTLFTSKGILIANIDQPFQNLSYLTSQDISHTAQMHFAKKRTIDKAAFAGLNLMSSCPLFAFPSTEFMISGSSSCLPWTGKSIIKWVEKIKEAQLKEEGESSESIADLIKIKSYPPIKSSVMNSLIQAAIPFVENYFELIKNMFDELEANKELADDHNAVARSVRIKIDKKYGKELEKIFPRKYKNEILSLKWFTDFEHHIQGAVAWLILLTTGLRNIDMRNLVIGCCQPSKRFDLLNYLITDIKKTDLTNYIIPVPPIIAKAVELATLAKKDRTGDMLLTQQQATASDSSSDDPRKISSNQTFNRLIHNFAEHYNIKLETVSSDDNDATAHCIRATLAGYIGANSHAAIIILKRLFGHSNNLMPDAYLLNNPIIIKQRRKNITDAQEEQATIMSQNIARGKVSGTKGKQMLEGLKHIAGELQMELKNESLTEMDFHIRLKERLKEILLMRIQGEDIYALKTPVGVICMRSQSDSTDSPCAKLSNHQKRKELNISKDVTDALATLPNPAQCVGKECSDALLGEDWSRDLLYSFDFYIKLVKGQGHKNIDIRNQAKHYINDYGPLLKDIYADEREETYFD
jgi:hypothetical protein